MTEDERVFWTGLVTLRAYEGITLAADTLAVISLQVGFVAYLLANFESFLKVLIAYIGSVFIGIYLVRWRGKLSFALMDFYEDEAVECEERQDSSPAHRPIRVFSDTGMRRLRRISYSQDQYQALFTGVYFVEGGLLLISLLQAMWPLLANYLVGLMRSILL